MIYLVTGCAGFIASSVSRLLLEQGNTVLGVDSLNDTYDPRLKQWRLAQLQDFPGFSFHHLDITDRPAINGLLKNKSVDAVLNLAARAGVRDSLEDPWTYFETNTTGNLNLLEACRSFGISKFVLSSTSSVYGDGERPCKEDGPADRPVSPYAASKRAAEMTCYTYHQQHGLDVTVLRYFTVYGPAGRPDMSVFRFIKQISEGNPIVVYGNGSQQRDFTFVGDIARGTIAALKPLGFETVNLGSDRPVVLTEAISTIEKCLGKSAVIEHTPRHPADVDATWANIDKARVLLGWEPEISFEEGVSQAVAWYQQNRDWAKDLL